MFVKTTTDRLMLMDPTLKKFNEGHWSEEFDQNLPGFSSFNDAGVECETGEFLYAMTRILKPNRVLETGTHWGISASYIGLALKDNKQGILETFEFEPQNHAVASNRLKTLQIDDVVRLQLADVSKLQLTTNYQLMFLDTEPILRFNELVKFYDRLEPGGFVFIHDTPRNLTQGNVNPDHPNYPSWPFGNIPESMRGWVKSGQLRAFHFPTPRGLVGFYKVHQDDVKW